MVIFHSCVSLPEGNLSLCSFDSLDWFKGNIYGVYHAKSPRYRGWNRFDFLTNPYHPELLSKNIPVINSVNPNPKIPKKIPIRKVGVSQPHLPEFQLQLWPSLTCSEQVTSSSNHESMARIWSPWRFAVKTGDLYGVLSWFIRNFAIIYYVISIWMCVINCNYMILYNIICIYIQYTLTRIDIFGQTQSRWWLSHCGPKTCGSIVPKFMRWNMTNKSETNNQAFLHTFQLFHSWTPSQCSHKLLVTDPLYLMARSTLLLLPQFLRVVPSTWRSTTNFGSPIRFTTKKTRILQILGQTHTYAAKYP